MRAQLNAQRKMSTLATIDKKNSDNETIRHIMCKIGWNSDNETIRNIMCKIGCKRQNYTFI